MQDIRVLRACHIASLGFGVFDIIQDLSGDPLPRRQDRDTRRITHDELAAHLPLRLPQRKTDLVRVKGLLGAGGHLGINILLAEKSRSIGVMAPFDLCQSADQALYLLRPVSDGKVRQNISNIAKLDLYIVLIPQDIVDLNACQTDIQCVNT